MVDLTKQVVPGRDTRFDGCGAPVGEDLARLFSDALKSDPYSSDLIEQIRSVSKDSGVSPATALRMLKTSLSKP